MTAPKTPTPQGISALLRKAGFARAEVKMRGGRSGFRVHKDYSSEGTVCVTHHFWSMGVSAERKQQELARYAEAIIAARFSAQVNGRDLIVTAGKEG